MFYDSLVILLNENGHTGCTQAIKTFIYLLISMANYLYF
jgi:hypothetical protein